jgi:hypothetical protein
MRFDLIAVQGGVVSCLFTGHQPPEALEAAHLYAYSKTPYAATFMRYSTENSSPSIRSTGPSTCR